MYVENKGVLSSIFGSSTQGVSLFSNNAFRRHTSTIVEGPVELEQAKKGSLRAPPAQIASPSFQSHETEQIRVPDTEEENGYRNKKKKKRQLIECPPSERLPSPKELPQQEAYDGSRAALAGKKNKLRRSIEKHKNCFVTEEVLAKREKGLHVFDDAMLKKKLKQQEDSGEPLQAQSAIQRGGRDRLQEEEGKQAFGFDLTRTQKEAKHRKRVLQDALECHKPMKRQKTSIEDGCMGTPGQTADPIRTEGSLKEAKTGTKRKKEDSLEARYEKKLRGLDDISTASQDSRPTSTTNEERMKSDGTNALTKKRKRVEGDENAIQTASPRTFDTDEKLTRTIFVGNLPLTVKRKMIMKEFSIYGRVESVRLRSVPLLDTKIPRKGAIITGHINEAVDSQHAYVVFEAPSDANAALAHNMKELFGNHVRVDAAYAPRGAGKGNSSLHYDHRRSLFAGNVPFDVKDEELYETFGAGKSPELDVEAVRVVRDPQTSLSKGIAYVLFKTRAGASFFSSPKRKVMLRDRILRIRPVLASRSAQTRPTSSKHARKLEETDNSELQRKRAKLSASYEGVRARKEPKERHKGTNKSSGQQQEIGSLKGRTKGPARTSGMKRKRAEKKQRGISRSKKIRRT